MFVYLSVVTQYKHRSNLKKRLTAAALLFNGHSITPSEFLALFFSFTVASYTLKTNSLHFYQIETTLFRIIQFPDTPAFHRLVNYPFHRSEFLKISIPSYTTVTSEFCILRKLYELQDTLQSLVYYLLRS